ncbi:MAG: acylneuraminate cytidylyltransferase [Spirochaetales bacterium]|uniref:Acylneuraminate cytidylyltransferase n=1 Tax=Candidatus Thalassospirochaeta sargassi TaxID=3119039 RepID=A0AAJ1IF98_9SPIO|nr:acylneuraminate cytidylyltransferase [Spirochaetales bacterium]
MSNRTGIFLQVRLGSSRLPGKALLEIEGKAIITHAMQALSAVDIDCRAILTDSSSANRLKPLAAASGFSLFEGAAEDVLDRYVSAAAEYGVDTIIRATGDNPLVDAEAAGLILQNHIECNADYSGFDDMPLGTGVEVLKTSALRAAANQSDDSYDHEHVSPYLYKNPTLFKINRFRAPERFCLPGSAVTVDTPDDFEYIRGLYAALYKGKPLTITDIIPWLRENRRAHE